ncbi:MAG: hypothetical protein RJQ03_02445, partial [Miltoncostaeaceae bacterium]
MRTGRRNTRAWLAVGAGLMIGMGGSVVAGQLTGQAAAQTPPPAVGGGFTLSVEQLRINQRISQAAVRRSNESLGLLDPVRPVSEQPEKVLGWRSSDIRDAAITTSKVLDKAITSVKIADNAVTPSQLSEGLREGQPRWARVAATGAANGQKGVESASRTGLGAYQVKFDRNVSTCAVQASVTSIDTAEPPKGHTIRVWTNPGDP